MRMTGILAPTRGDLVERKRWAWLPGHVPVVQMFDSDPDAEPVFLLRGVDALPASFVLA